ncbi:hypothetical protein BGZ88_012155 [Linnemannia elongata]|nr:hypothetical protein BGZ88_012155 [Linnemannia elongata]
MQDAVILANHLYDIKPTSFENIKTALSGYRNERFDAIKDQYPQSHMSAKLIYGHMSKDTAYRPQANFLPQAPKRGTLDDIPQRPSKQFEQDKKEAKPAAAAL